MGESMLGHGDMSQHEMSDGVRGFSENGANLAAGSPVQQLRQRLIELETKIGELQREANMRLDEIGALNFYAQKLEVALKRQSANVAGLCDFRDAIMREIAEVAEPARFKLMDREYRLRRFDEAFSRFMCGDQLIYRYGE